MSFQPFYDYSKYSCITAAFMYNYYELLSNCSAIKAKKVKLALCSLCTLVNLLKLQHF